MCSPPAASYGRPSANSAEENWKRSFICTVRPPVYTSPPRKRSFLRTLFEPEKFETSALCFSLNAKRYFKNEAFSSKETVSSLTEFNMKKKNDRQLPID